VFSILFILSFYSSRPIPIPTKITTQSGSHNGIKKGESVELGQSIPGWTGMIGTPFSDGTRLGVSLTIFVGAIFFAVLVVFQLDKITCTLVIFWREINIRSTNPDR